jgi:hypothetical protein
MKTFNSANITSSKSFLSACNSVFGGISGRNQQLQELLVIAVAQAAKVDSNGNVGNNLSWLSSILVLAEQTNGINLAKIAVYVKEVLCQKTVKWDAKKQTLSKLNKDTSLSYNVEPSMSWYDYGKPAKLEAVFDVAGTLRRAIDNSRKKGDASNSEILAVIASLDFTTAELMEAFESIEPTF